MPICYRCMFCVGFVYMSFNFVQVLQWITHKKLSKRREGNILVKSSVDIDIHTSFNLVKLFFYLDFIFLYWFWSADKTRRDMFKPRPLVFWRKKIIGWQSWSCWHSQQAILLVSIIMPSNTSRPWTRTPTWKVSSARKRCQHLQTYTYLQWEQCTSNCHVTSPNQPWKHCVSSSSLAKSIQGTQCGMISVPVVLRHQLSIGAVSILLPVSHQG